MRTTLASVLLFAAVAAAGCKHHQDSPPTTTPGMGSGGTGTGEPVPGTVPGGKRAVTNLSGTAGHEGIKGTVDFADAPGGGVSVTAHVEGLTPGDHGFHIHEKGDCSAPDATSAGGHFNPGGHKHGAPDATDHHEGDLGNLTAGADGKADRSITLHDVTIGTGAANDIVGKGFILHDKPDDFATQPTGNAGARIACGVITAQ